MTYILTVSSQGQVVIPAKMRKAASLKPGSKIHASLKQTPLGPQINLTATPEKIDWVKALAGSATGMYGDVEKYIENERNSWDRD